MQQEFKLQDPGEGIHEVDIIEVLVAEGDTVSEGQDVLTVESDKAAIELPSPHAGTVSEIRVKEGDTVVVGDVLIVFDDGASGDDADEDAAAVNAESEDAAEAQATEKSGADEEDPRDENAQDETDDDDKGDADERSERTDRARQRDDGERTGRETDDAERDAEQDGGDRPVRASPAARKVAEERGVDLADVEPGGAEGQVTVEDVKAAAPRKQETDATETERAKEPVQEDEDDFGPVTRQRMSSIRASTARAMTRSWNRIPHVVHEDAADITKLELWRRNQEDEAPSLTPIVAKAVTMVLQDHPRFNATLDDESGEIVLRNYRNINIAVATDRGLVTPVVRGTDGKSVRQLAREMADLAEKARDRKLKKDDIAGGTFTITNVGSLGGRGLSPIINAPQTAILGLGRARMEAVPVGDIDTGQVGVEARMILPLALAFDHRVIDGADAARFTNDLMALLADPVSMALDA